jgi:hypothetical protein
LSAKLPATGALSGYRPWSPDEDAAVRARYARGKVVALASELGRSTVAVKKRAQALGLNLAPRWTADHDQELRSHWGELSVGQIAKTMKRTAKTVYWRARKLQLPCGATQGLEFLTHAADRCGFDTATLRRILKDAGVRLQLSASRPCKAKRHYHVVDPDDVDRAVAAWCDSEIVNVAAKAHGVSCDTLRRWLTEARAAGLKVPAEPPRKAVWRVPSKTIAAVIAWRESRESVRAGALRVGVTVNTLNGWLRAAGVERGTGKPWYVEKALVDSIVAERRARRGSRAPKVAA